MPGESGCFVLWRARLQIQIFLLSKHVLHVASASSRIAYIISRTTHPSSR